MGLISKMSSYYSVSKFVRIASLLFGSMLYIHLDMHAHLAACVTQEPQAYEICSTELYAILLKQLTTAIDSTIVIIKKCKMELGYWQQQQQNPFSYFIHKAPTKWFKGNKQKEEVESHIQSLADIMNQQAAYLGKLKTLQHEITIKNKDDFDTLYQTAVCINNTLKRIVVESITTRSITKPQALNEVIADNDLYIKKIKKIHAAIFKNHKRPHHLIRNWLPYTAATALALFGGYFYITNQKKTHKFASDTKKSCMEFFNTHAVEPTKAMWDIFYKKNEIKPIMPEAMITGLEEESRNAVLQYLNDKHPENIC